MQQEGMYVDNYQGSFWSKAFEVVIIAMVVLIPIIFYPRVIGIFNPIKILTFSILVIIGLVFWGFNVLKKEEFKIISNPLNLPILSFIIVCAFSLLWSDSPFVSLKELSLFLSGPLLYFIIVNNIFNERQINRIIGAVIIVGSLFGVYGIFQYNGIDLPFWIGNYGRGKVFGLFGNAGYFAEYLILPLPIAISLFLVSKNKIIKILLFIGILAMGSTIALTFTRTPYLALGISFAFMLLLFIISQGKNFFKENKKIFIVILIAVVLIISLFVIPTPLSEKGTVISKIKERASVAQLGSDFSTGRRIAIWKYTTLMIKDHLWLGAGIGTFKYNTLKYQAKFLDQGENRFLYPYGIAEKAHNEYLQIWAELGIVGLLIFIWIIFSYFNYGLKILRKIKNDYKQGIIIGLMGSVMVFLIDSLFWFPLHHSFTTFLFWLCLSLLIVMGLKEDETIYKSKFEKKLLNTKNNIHQLKPLLIICIILLAAILSISAARPFIARTYWYNAYRNIESEDWNKTIKIYREALKWDPYLGEVYYDIGKILLSNEFYTPALENFEKAEKYIDHPDLPLDFAKIYNKKGLVDKVTVKLKQAISYQPDEKSMLPLYAELGNIYIIQKRYVPAEIVLKKALKIDNNFVNAHYGLAGVYLNQNKLQEALEELQKVIELAPDSPQARFSRDMIQKLTQEKIKTQPTETDNP
jgi:O-antigen ligase/Tfp pilus assembly protein PilF